MTIIFFILVTNQSTDKNPDFELSEFAREQEVDRESGKEEKTLIGITEQEVTPEEDDMLFIGKNCVVMFTIFYTEVKTRHPDISHWIL